MTLGTIALEIETSPLLPASEEEEEEEEKEEEEVVYWLLTQPLWPAREGAGPVGPPQCLGRV